MSKQDQFDFEKTLKHVATIANEVRSIVNEILEAKPTEPATSVDDHQDERPSATASSNIITSDGDEITIDAEHMQPALLYSCAYRGRNIIATKTFSTPHGYRIEIREVP